MKLIKPRVEDTLALLARRRDLAERIALIQATRVGAYVRRSKTGNLVAVRGYEHKDPSGPPSGRLKHAVLIIGGRRYKGPSHFHALMSYAESNPEGKLPRVPEEAQGFETESGHFLNRAEAEDYALRHGLINEPSADERLRSEDLRLAASLKASDDPIVVAHDLARARAQERYRRAAARVIHATEAHVLEGDRKRDKQWLALLLLLLLGASRTAYREVAEALSKLPQAGEGLDSSELNVPLQAGEAEAFAESRRKFLSEFATDVLEHLTAQAEFGIALGEARDQLTSRLEEAGSALLEGRAKRFSRTEAQVAYGKAQIRQLARAGYATKAWITVGDDRVRESHEACEAAGDIPLEKAFPNGLQHPGDPDGPPEEVCNCRCVLVGVRRHSTVKAREPSESAKAILRDSRGRILLLKDADTNYWDLPGGHKKPGETDVATVLREVNEETGLVVSGLRPLSNTVESLGGRATKVLLFSASGDGPVRLSKEHREYRWVAPGDLSKYDLGSLNKLVETHV